MATLDPNGNTPIGTTVCWHEAEFGDITGTVDQWGYVTEVAAWGYLLTGLNPRPNPNYDSVWVCVGLVDYNTIEIGACSTGNQPVTVSNFSWAGENVTGRVCIAPTSLSCTKSINDSDISGLEVGCCATVVLTRQATFDLRVGYKKDGVAKTFTITDISHAAGTVTYGLVHENVFWEVASYTDLVITVQNIR